MSNIDFVIIWVDGSDPAWQKEKNLWLRRSQGLSEQGSDGLDAGENRYRDWDNLKYWFRGVEKYAPWVNKIHFVTCGHVPAWLNPDAPKLHLVKHSDYIPEEYLPTFSSHPIELYLHRIPGLSPQFVYFNDDFFLTAPVEPSDFFCGGLPRDCIVENPQTFVNTELFNQILVNDLVFLNRHYSRTECRKRLRGKWYSPKLGLGGLTKNIILGALHNPRFFGLQYCHMCQPFLKSSLEKAWELAPDWLSETASHKFRDGRDLNQYVFRYVQLMEGQFSPYNQLKFGHGYSIGTQLEEICRCIETGKYPAICANDSCVTDFDQAKARLLKAFDKALPEKSAFER